LEVFLLEEISGTPREVERIAALARLIRPERVQLNTVARPPADALARRVARRDLDRFARAFTGKAEIISERGGEFQPPPSRTEVDAEIMGLLRRRPCTVGGISIGLGLPAAEVAKRLEALHQRGVVAAVHADDQLFYEATRT
jgi:wyosine [tRNA(Phe)-imidazoG37] synthetase (radical SAM superfamily)